MPALSIITLVAAADLCRPWASLTAQKLVNEAWTRAYTLCLNSDELPALPQGWQAILDTLKPIPLYKDPPGSRPAAGAKSVDPTYTKCAATHPRGYDPKAHTYNTRVNGRWRPVPCPKD